ncbi:hypothetical protein BAUCODRAFT_257964 [Baudoinia panamericana UAMH 10762]|uniref:Pre-mRNA-splicing factor n=1 Tax=Baudoinia panamericana (strain UAMH 10762) TaxID=717646 RepID=M2M8G9_BAUPA|nr:uncharacterized protein BAUCODRAFT_257964 [Baudoinia panamericana UAMH 10762]EMC92681.1 hypothetical protein BAUCODRAFT_257964 [Baudoinia panamericana UAMH 10762]
MSRPTTADLVGDHPLAQVARKQWLTSKPSKVLPETLQGLWDAVESDANAPYALLLLEQLQALERYLWPSYSDDSSNHHVLLIALLVNIKRQEKLPAWSLFADRPDEFSSFFRRVTHWSLDSSLSMGLRTHLLSFLVNAFQSLDDALVRRECQPLVSIGIWQDLHSDESRQERLNKSTQLQKAWRAATKRLENADVAGQAKLRFERSWLYTLVLHCIDKLYDSDTSADQRRDNLQFCERFLELMCDLLAQLPTRRYVNALLQDLNLQSAALLSPLYQDGDDAALLREMHQLLHHYMYFPIDDHNGKQLSQQEHDEAHNARIARLQNVALKLHPEKLKILVLSNYGSLAQREELLSHLKVLNDAELIELTSHLDLRTTYPERSNIILDRTFFNDLIATVIEHKAMYTSTVSAAPVLPTESSLYDPILLRADNYTGSHPLPIPKLNLQYLSLGDFLYRSFMLYRAEAFSVVRQHIEDTIKRLQLRIGGGQVRFDGFSRMAIPISKPAIIETVPPRVGEEMPAEVRVEVLLDVSRLQPGLRREWESFKEGDVVFLLDVQPPAVNDRSLTNGHAAHGHLQSAAEKAGVKVLRCAEVISVLDDNGRVLRREHEAADQIDGFARPRQRRLLLRLDGAAYKRDKERADAGKGDVLESINVILRRRARENTFKAVLDNIKQLTLTQDVPVPDWLRDVFLGFGDPSAAAYKRLPNRVARVDYGDTFLDWQHLIEGLEGKRVEVDPGMEGSFPPPYILETTASTQAANTTVPRAKKRRHDQPDGPEPAPSATAETVKVTTYKPPTTGPYSPSRRRRTGSGVRFTPRQIEAITSGTQPGLTLILGPPGTGKTDVTTQIIANVYRNFPRQRTLVIAHSNQALDQVFAKIGSRHVDERHLLRLGHGEVGDKSEAEAGKLGRLEGFVERTAGLLMEVQRLADSIGAVGAHGGSCETASYFAEVIMRPLWKRFWDAVAAGEGIVEAFPFHAYFTSAPHPLFSPASSSEELIEIVRGCERHMDKMFEEVAEMRPLEILRHQRDKMDYLLVSEARIVAMTATYAAMRWREMTRLGVGFDNVVVEEAAQMVEIEAFVPMVLQGRKETGGLQRLILVGDHLQNAPVIQNAAYRDYAGMEQSLFQRLIRLGVPHTILDAQGRSRPSLAQLVMWRYPHLTNLSFTTTAPEFVRANAGLRHEYQFISVPDYKGRGETEPSPHFFQNLGEAEYAVALFQYMRLLGYPAEKISILCAYAGQRALVRDVLAHRCKGAGVAGRLFGMPGWVGTVDKYQGEQNDYVILSLVRTKGVGFMRDLRRLTVALSRARLGLYVLGRREVFESSLELREAFGALLAKPERLAVVANEMYPTTRLLEDDVESVEMSGVEHLGQYVYEMTQAKIKALKEGAEMLPPAATTVGGLEEDGEGEEAEEAMDDVDEADQENVVGIA